MLYVMKTLAPIQILKTLGKLPVKFNLVGMWILLRSNCLVFSSFELSQALIEWISSPIVFMTCWLCTSFKWLLKNKCIGWTGQCDTQLQIQLHLNFLQLFLQQLHCICSKNLTSATVCSPKRTLLKTSAKAGSSPCLTISCNSTRRKWSLYLCPLKTS